MENNDILNLEEQFDQVKNEENQDDLLLLITEIKRNHFLNVLKKSASYRKKYHDQPKLINLLFLSRLSVMLKLESINSQRQS